MSKEDEDKSDAIKISRLTCNHINHGHLKNISIPMLLLLWMNVILDFMCIGFSDIRGTGRFSKNSKCQSLL